MKTPNSETDLLDLNVWLALSDADHAHHERARAYWEQASQSKVAFTRVTMLGLMRLSTSAATMAGRPFTVDMAWANYRRFRNESNVVFLDEPSNLEKHLERWSLDFGLGGRHWLDIYLASFAYLSGARFITFDKGFSRFDGLDWLLLS